MIYKKSTTTTGAWAKGSELEDIKVAKIVSETKAQPSNFTNKDGSAKDQDVCKIRFAGKEDVYNISLNKATINGLVDAFGEDSKEWINKELTVETEKVRVAGVARIAIYLIADGYQKVDNDEGFAVIQKIGDSKDDLVKDMDDIPVIDEEEPSAEDLAQLG